MPEPPYLVSPYDAKASDLLPGAVIVVTCLTCRRRGEVPTDCLRQILPKHYRLKDLTRRFKCTECGHRRATMDA
jgi:hypothetical protein